MPKVCEKVAANKRTQFQINKDKRLIIKLLDGGQHSHAEIAEKINERYRLEGIEIELSRSQITSDIKNILDELEEDLIKESRLLIPLQTRRYLWVYSEAQKAWVKSQKPKTKMTITERVEKGSLKVDLSSYADEKEKYSTGFDETKEVEESREGDPRFLAIADRVLSKIDRLNGLYIKKPLNDEEEDDEDEEEAFETDIPDNGRD